MQIIVFITHSKKNPLPGLRYNYVMYHLMPIWPLTILVQPGDEVDGECL